MAKLKFIAPYCRVNGVYSAYFYKANDDGTTYQDELCHSLFFYGIEGQSRQSVISCAERIIQENSKNDCI